MIEVIGIGEKSDQIMGEVTAPITEEEKVIVEEVTTDDSIMGEMNATDKITQEIGMIGIDRTTAAERATNTARRGDGRDRANNSQESGGNTAHLNSQDARHQSPAGPSN